jgi:hypothetical protein
MVNTASFLNVLQDNASPIAIEVDRSSSSVLIAFGGIQGSLGMPPFEFFNLAAGIGTSKIFVRDLEQAWYHFGLPGLSRDIEGTAKLLRNEVTRLAPGRVIMCGNSMGGYAAILFGHLLEVDEVHAFCPQTFIGRFRRMIFRDKRWAEQMRRLHSSGEMQRDYSDLRRLVLARTGNKPIIHIHFSLTNRLDKRHALRMGNLDSVILHGYAEKMGHKLVRSLRDSGRLREIITGALTQP